MSQVSQVGINRFAVEIPESFGDTLRSFATAKPLPQESQSAVQDVFKRVISFKADLNNRKDQPTNDQLQTGLSLLKQLREVYRNSLEGAKQDFSVASAKDRRIPLLGIRIPFLAGKESREMEASLKLVKAQDSKLAALQKQFETKEASLTAAHEGMKVRCLTVQLPAAKELSNLELKSHMPDAKTVYVAGNRQETVYGMFEALFACLNMEQNGVKVKARADTFGTTQGIAPDSIKGRDLDVLKLAGPGRFGDMADAFYAHCNKPQFTHRDKSAYFVPSEVVKERKIYISMDDSETVTISHQATFELARKEGQEAVATVSATYTTRLGVDGKAITSCSFNNIQPKVLIARLPDYEKLERIFSEKSKVTAPEAAAETT